MSAGNDRLLDLIQADLDGALPAAERAELARLLLQDPEARRLHGQLQRTDQLLRDIPAAEPPAGLRDAVITGPARPEEAPGHWNRLSTYRIAAAFLGGILVVGAAYYVSDGRPAGEELQGSVSAGKDLAVAAAERHVSIRAEGIEVDATLRSVGEVLHLEIASSATTSGELAVKIDPAATSLAGSADDASVTAAGDEVGVQLPAGRHVRVLEFSGSAPIRLELRAEGRVLGQAELPVNAP